VPSRCKARMPRTTPAAASQARTAPHSASDCCSESRRVFSSLEKNVPVPFSGPPFTYRSVDFATRALGECQGLLHHDAAPYRVKFDGWGNQLYHAKYAIDKYPIEGEDGGRIAQFAMNEMWVQYNDWVASDVFRFVMKYSQQTDILIPSSCEH